MRPVGESMRRVCVRPHSHRYFVYLRDVCVRCRSYNKDMELEDAINTAILTLKEGFEGAITEENIEIAVVGVDKKFRVLSDQEVRDYVKEVSEREKNNS